MQVQCYNIFKRKVKTSKYANKLCGIKFKFCTYNDVIQTCHQFFGQTSKNMHMHEVLGPTNAYAHYICIMMYVYMLCRCIYCRNLYIYNLNYTCITLCADCIYIYW